LIQKICRPTERCDGKTKLKDAVRTGVGKSKGKELVICCMDFAFIGGSYGSCSGKKLQEELITQLKQTSFVISKSEEPVDGSSLFLMQLAKHL
jgi:acetyl-CoA carboxylase carboxyl transferase subunit beta